MGVLRRGELRAVHVIAGLDPAHGGPSYSVPRLCRALSAAGVEVELLSVAGGNASPSAQRATGYYARSFTWDFAGTPFLCGLRFSSELRSALFAAAQSCGVIHNHGLWLMPNVRAGQAALRAGRPFIVSPRGMLSPAALAFSRTRKRVFWNLAQGTSVQRAACIHATSEQEYQDVRAHGLTNPVAIISNGIDVPEPSTGIPSPSANERVVLYLGRIHPKKGIDRLLQAWRKAQLPGWRLRIVGPDQAGHADELKALMIQLRLTHVSIEPPLYDEGKLAAYREADLFVLPTLGENFAGTIAEALACGTAVISTKGAPWRELETEGCGWWIDHGPEPLAVALEKAMAMPRTELKLMGAKGREWMARDFSWDRVAGDMLAVYKWLLGGGQAPSTVRLD